jgi:hypothetical protein
VRRISLARRDLPECLAEELRRLEPDETYAETLTKGLAKVGARGSVTAAGRAVHGAAARKPAVASKAAPAGPGNPP